MTKQSLDKRIEEMSWEDYPSKESIRELIRDVLTEVLPTIEQVDEEISKLSMPDKIFYGGQKSIIHRANTNLNNLLGEK